MMKRVLMTVGALLCVGLAAAQAHENRQVGSYTLAVGFRAEPAFEDVVNAIDIFVNRTSDGKAISVRDGDIVTLIVEVQLLETDKLDAEVLAAALLQEGASSKILPPPIDTMPGLNQPMMVPMPSESWVSSKTPAMRRVWALRQSMKPLYVGAALRASLRASIASKTHKPFPANRRLAIATTTPSVLTRGAPQLGGLSS